MLFFFLQSMFTIGNAWSLFSFTTKIHLYEKLLSVFAVTLAMAVSTASYAAGCASVSIKTAADNCGRVLSFRVVCTNSSGCSCDDLYATANDYISSHTSSSGCYYL